MKKSLIAPTMAALALVFALPLIAVACGGDTPELVSPPRESRSTAAVATGATHTPAATATRQAKATPTQISPTDSSPIAPKTAQPTAAPAAPAAAKTSGGIQMGGHLRVTTPYVWRDWDFTQTEDSFSLFHGGWAYSGLLQFSPRDGLEIWPDMAESWEVRDSSRTYIFHIDEDLTEWHDGHPFSIDDIIYAIERWKNPPEGVIQPRAGAFKLIDTMEAVDDRTLEIRLKEPFGDFIAEAANPWHMFIPRHILEANDNTITRWQDVIGTGPYKIVNVEGGGIFVTMEKNDNYFRSDPDGNPYPYLDKVTSITMSWDLLPLVGGNYADASITLGSQIYEKDYYCHIDEFTCRTGPLPTVISVQLNNETPPFDDINARKAIMYGVSKWRKTTPRYSDLDVVLFSPTSWFSYLHPSAEEIAKIPGYDQNKSWEEAQMAREFAEQSGLKEFDLIWMGEPGYAKQIQRDMKNCCGVQVNIIIQDWPTAMAAVEDRRYQAAYGGTSGGYAGVIPIIDTMYTPDGSRNGGWDPPDDWMAAWTKAKAMQPGPERNALFDEMFNIMMNDWVPTVPLYAENQIKVHGNYVHNWQAVGFSNNKLEDVWLDCDAPNPGQNC